jgi:2-polyprenyl-6-hydroxyphenyl methylase/3-demethylubiquinone-9 3-methyltransferase
MGQGDFDWRQEVDAGERFRFGANWQHYLADLDNHRVQLAEKALHMLFGDAGLQGRTFLDVGCGSGIHSLAARNLGATVRSFDYDGDAVKAARQLKARNRHDDEEWTIDQGSVLDPSYLASLGTFNVVYTWGVLHHTGAMWQSIDNVLSLVAPGGFLAIAIYNDQGAASRRALAMKRLYNRSPALLRSLMVVAYGSYVATGAFVLDIARARNPLRRYRQRERGMSYWRDVVDWVGGYPFEVARPQDIMDSILPAGFTLVTMMSVGDKSGNNEYVFRRDG